MAIAVFRLNAKLLEAGPDPLRDVAIFDVLGLGDHLQIPELHVGAVVPADSLPYQVGSDVPIAFGWSLDFREGVVACGGFFFLFHCLVFLVRLRHFRVLIVLLLAVLHVFCCSCCNCLEACCSVVAGFAVIGFSCFFFVQDLHWGDWAIVSILLNIRGHFVVGTWCYFADVLVPFGLSETGRRVLGWGWRWSVGSACNSPSWGSLVIARGKVDTFRRCRHVEFGLNRT